MRRRYLVFEMSVNTSKRTLSNLFSLYRPLLDTLHFFDNSSETPRLIFKEESGEITIEDVEIYEQLRHNAGQ